MDSALTLLLFAAVATGTPGPNNLMVMASGANFGYRRTLPHILGIGLGFAVMIALVGLGLARLFVLVPWLETLLLVLSALFLAYLAFRIATAAPPEPGAPPGEPFTALQAAAFQWVNPKAWAIALSASTLHGAGWTAAAFLAVSLPLISIWCIAGEGIGRILSSPARLRIFNYAMAALLIVTMIPAFAAGH